MRSVILRLLARDGPSPGGQIELSPLHRPQLVTPLRGQKEELEHRAERPAKSVATGPEEADFVVRERSIAGRFLYAPPDPSRRIAVNQILVERPGEQGLQPGERAVGLDQCAAIGNLIQERVHLPPRDFSDRGRTPSWLHVPFDNASRFFDRRRTGVLLDVLLQIASGDRTEGFGLLGLRFLSHVRRFGSTRLDGVNP